MRASFCQSFLQTEPKQIARVVVGVKGRFMSSKQAVLTPAVMDTKFVRRNNDDAQIEWFSAKGIFSAKPGRNCAATTTPWMQFESAAFNIRPLTRPNTAHHRLVTLQRRRLDQCTPSSNRKHGFRVTCSNIASFVVITPGPLRLIPHPFGTLRISRMLIISSHRDER